MDWQSKFYSIVKETEDNLAKAKEKLSGKASTALSASNHHKPESILSPRTARVPYTNFQHSHCASVPLPETSALNMSGASCIQVLHMQEQIDSQNRTIEKLQQLVRSLDNERDYYKEQISHLKGEIDGLTDRMSSQLALANTEWQMAGVKREVMREIQNVKSMLATFAKEVSRKPVNSPRCDGDIWTVKESLLESLEQVRLELSLTNKRIDRMESQIASESTDRKDPLCRSLHTTTQFESSPHLHTPTYKCQEYVNSLDVQQLRLTINALNSKLNELEKRTEAPPSYSLPVYSPLRSQPICSTPSTVKESQVKLTNDNMDDLCSLSGLSDLNISSDTNLDDDIDTLTYEMQDAASSPSQKGASTTIYKSDRLKKGKVDFDLTDLDLSDVDDIDLETDSLDLDN